jgi:hypothetical protein
VCRQISLETCPWNVRFAQELKEPAFAARAASAGKDSRALAQELLAMDDKAFRDTLRTRR